MLIGLDFDNTIVRYDRVFHAHAVETGAITADVAATKFAVRDHLRRSGREEIWTEMQGHVYGTRMLEAEPFDGVLAFLSWARAVDLQVAIVSHKTRYPYRGPAHDLHDSARSWIRAVLCDADGPLVPEQRIFFELTKEAKLRRIAAIGCDYFIDDLPEILLAPEFPPATRRILFAPDGAACNAPVMVLPSWKHIMSHFEAP